AVLRREVTSAPARRQIRLHRSSDGATQDWLVWHRDLTAPGHDGQRVEIAFRVRAGISGPELTACPQSPLAVFFPTQKETFLGFLIQGPYRTTPARDNVPEHDPSNQFLAAQTAALLPVVLADLRDDGLLTAAVLQALPLDETRFGPGSLLRELFEATAHALAAGEFVPAGDGQYARAADLALTHDGGLRELLSPGQLGALSGHAGHRGFASGSITPETTPALWRYLRSETGIAEVTPESFTASMTGAWLADQLDGWIRRLYAFLYQHLSLWSAPELPGDDPGPARSQPIIRLEDGSQVAPFDAAGRSAVYLPVPGSPVPAATVPAGTVPAGTVPAGTGPALPTVKLAIARFPDARRFLEALQLGEPDLVAEVLEVILPRYAALAAAGLDTSGLDASGLDASELDATGPDATGLGIAGLDAAQHQADLERVAIALGGATPAQREQITAQLTETPFLIGENAATGAQALMPPDRLYQRTPDLESYFGGNPGAWFARDTYGPWLLQLREMGVRDTVAVHARPPGPDGHVAIAEDFARHERGLQGFDPDATIDGLDFALGHPSHRRSEFIWNQLLLPHRDLLAGTVERSVRLGFADASREETRSAIGAAAAAAAWLPGPDGSFGRPAELELDDLPPTFQPDDSLALALGMIQPVVAQAARQLGLPAGLLRGLAAHPDLVAMVEQELAARADGPGDGPRPVSADRGCLTDDPLAGWLRDQ
ncbi:MAG: hypothetical protein ABJB47_17960, partial [Actinomycetota bacterium]